MTTLASRTRVRASEGGRLTAPCFDCAAELVLAPGADVAAALAALDAAHPPRAHGLRAGAAPKGGACRCRRSEPRASSDTACPALGTCTSTAAGHVPAMISWQVTVQVLLLRLLDDQRLGHRWVHGVLSPTSSPDERALELATCTAASATPPAGADRDLMSLAIELVPDLPRAVEAAPDGCGQSGSARSRAAAARPRPPAASAGESSPRQVLGAIRHPAAVSVRQVGSTPNRSR